MPDTHGQQQTRDFLEAELSEARHKITRLEHVRRDCHDCAEAAGLDAMIRSAAAECTIIEDLLARQVNSGSALGLSAQIMSRINQLRQQANRTSTPWRRGRPVPAAYWKNAQQRTILEQLLRRWHAWRAGRPYYPAAVNGANNADNIVTPHRHATTAPPRANIWGTPSQPTGPAEPAAHEDPEKLLERNEARRAALLAVLARAGIVQDHVEIIFASDHMAVVTAYAHSEAERRVIINAIIGADDIDTVLADIRVSDPRYCIACRARPAGG